MDKSKSSTPQTFEEELKTLSFESKALLNKTALDNLKVKKSLDQLSELLRRKNEKAISIPPERKSEKYVNSKFLIL
jgi:hypothetical protein